jgi:DNA-binding NarL/FixJ family response regulator
MGRNGREPASIRVLIAHEHRLLLNALVPRLEDAGDLEVVGTTHMAEAVVKLVRELDPDVLLLGYAMASNGPLPVLEHVRAAHPTTAIVLLADALRPDLVHAALVGRGAKGIIDESAPGDAYPPALRAALRGEAPVIGFAPEQPVLEPALTAREQAVLLGIARGLSTDQIANDLSIARATVAFHTRNAYSKLGVSSRLEALRALVEKAIVPYEWL